jgi:lambda family phage portal protein
MLLRNQKAPTALERFGTGLDRAIAAVSPAWATRRLHRRAILNLAGAYTGARSDRAGLIGWHPSSGSADADLVPELPTLRRRSRDLLRNAPLAAGAIATVTTNVVGTGLKPFPRPDAETLGLSEDEADAWQSATMAEWRLFAESHELDIGGRDGFDGLQSIAFRSTLENGDTLCLFRNKPRRGVNPYRTRLQLVESDRLCTPTSGLGQSDRLVDGVELDEDGAAVAYWVHNRHPGALFLPARPANEFKRVPAFTEDGDRRVALHLYRRLRIGQTRGAPYLAPVIEALKQLTRYTDAEIMAAVVNSCFAITTKTQDADGLGLAKTDATNKAGDQIEIVEAGQIVDLNIDESVESFTPGRPNAAFEPFMVAVLRQVGVALEIPFEILIKHFTSSYSASRAAMMEAWRFFRERRQWLCLQLCTPVYEAFLREAIALGRLEAPGFFDDPLLRQAWSGVEWIGPGQGHLDPQREVDAADKRIALGISTREDECQALTGGDWRRKHEQLVKENALRKRDGLAALPAPAGPPAAPPAPPPADPEDPEDPDETTQEDT